MHIAFVSPFKAHEIADLLDEASTVLLSQFEGVVATPVTPLVRELHKAGHHLSVFSLDPSAQEDLVLSGERLDIFVFPKRRSRSCLLDVYRKERKKISKALIASSPDVISAQWSYDHALAALDSKLPCVVTCHDTPLRYAFVSKTVYMTYHVFVAAMVFRRASHLACVSPYTAQHIEKIFRPRGEVRVIPNGLPDSVISGAEGSQGSQKAKAGELVICSIGGWGRLKNIKRLLQAFQLTRAKRPGARLVLFGIGLGEGEPAEEWAKASSLEEGVSFRGKKPYPGILEFLRNEADLMVHPSLIETHGMVLIEAMINGVPVIAGKKSGAVPWTLGDGKYGSLCDVRSPGQIALAIDDVISHPEETAKTVNRARESVKERFSISRVKNSYEEIFEELVSAGHPKN